MNFNNYVSLRQREFYFTFISHYLNQIIIYTNIGYYFVIICYDVHI
jgi:hypothetical protein